MNFNDLVIRRVEDNKGVGIYFDEADLELITALDFINGDYGVIANYDCDIDLIEDFADFHGLISNEHDLSVMFWDMIKECYPDFDYDDEPLVNETFNNWTDCLCKDGQIHEVQYNEYALQAR